MSSFFPDAIASWNLFMGIFDYKDVPSIGILENDITLSVLIFACIYFRELNKIVFRKYLFSRAK